MGAFSARVERHESTLRFLTNGERIAPDDTCEKWELEDGDIIEVFNEQIGGGDEMQVEGEAKEEGDTKGWAMATDFANDLNACIEKLDEDEATAKQYINFSVEDDEMIIDCKIRPTTRMISLIKAFAKYHGLVANNVIISFRGIYLDGTETTGSVSLSVPGLLRDMLTCDRWAWSTATCCMQNTVSKLAAGAYAARW